MNELAEFLRTIDRLQEPGLIFSEKLNPDKIIEQMEAAFAGRHVFSLRATSLIEPTEEDVFETFRNSFEGRGVLAVMVGARIPKTVQSAVSRMCGERRLSRNATDGGDTIQPPQDWRLVVLAQVADPQALPPNFADLFDARLAL